MIGWWILAQASKILLSFRFKWVRQIQVTLRLDKSHEGSVSEWIACLKQGDQSAAQDLWERYFKQLMRLSHGKLCVIPLAVCDEEDVALSAFESFCRAASSGRYPNLVDRENLWKILVAITARKSVTALRQEMFQTLSVEQPDNPQYPNQIVGSLNMQMMLLKKTGQTAEAVATLRSAVAVQQERVASYPANKHQLFQAASILDRLGRFLDETGVQDDALQSLETAHATFRDLADESPETVTHFRFLAGVCNRKAKIFVKQKRQEQARDQQKEAASRVRKVMQTPQAVPPDRQLLITPLKDLKAVCEKLKDEPGAADAGLQLKDL